MKKEDLFDLLGEAGEGMLDSIPEKPPYSRRKRLLKYGGAAACFLLILGGLIGSGIFMAGEALPQENIQTETSEKNDAESQSSSAEESRPEQDENEKQDEPASDPGTDSLDSWTGSLLSPNPISGAECFRSSHEMELSAEDAVILTRREAEAYYDFPLPVDRILPELNRISWEGCFYAKEQDMEQLYRDTGTFTFRNPGGEKQAAVTLSRVFLMSGFHPENPEKELLFTPVNGRELVVFSIRKEGQPALFAEWMEGQTGVRLYAEGISDAEFYQLLEAMVSPAEEAEQQRLTGTITVLDPYAGLIGVTAEDGRNLTLILPENIDITRFHLWEKATLSWRGEPAALLTVWPGQLIEIVHEKEE